MFESAVVQEPACGMPPSSADLAAFRTSLRALPDGLDDAARLERIHRLEELRAAVAAAQALEVAAFVTSRRATCAQQIAATPRPGVGTRRRLAEAERGIVADVAIARHESPAQASGFISFSLRVPTELPAVFAQLAAGTVNERRTQTVHRATAWLTPDDRRLLDRGLAPGLRDLGDQQVLAHATAAAYRADPAGACARVAAAENDRAVSLRPAADAMTWLTALLPLTQGVAAWAALDKAAGAAGTAQAAGDPRGRGQVMADTLIERLTGQTTASDVAVQIHLLMTDQTLLGRGTGADEPARIVGHGPIPAGTARDLLLRDTPYETPHGTPRDQTTTSAAPGSTRSPDRTHRTAARSIRRLFTNPAGHLVAMETTTRTFTPAMARFIRTRDNTCRTPWCNAPIRHIDHIQPHTDGGPTSVTNARGLCARCNLTQQAADTTSRTTPPHPDQPHTVVGLTPTGQPHHSRPPQLPGRQQPRTPRTPGAPRAPDGHPPLRIDIIWQPHRDHATGSGSTTR